MIIKNNSEQYTWMPVFEAIANWIVDYEDNQERLLDILRRNGVNASREYSNESDSHAINMMDPFTFLLLITRSQSKHNLLVGLFHTMRSDAITPADFDGIPDFRDRKKYVFPEDPKLRTAEIGSVLWKLFHQARASNIQDETFKQALAIPDTGFVLITLCLYLVCPTNYLPIDSHMRNWLIEHNIKQPKFNWTDYERTLNEVKRVSDKPFWQIYDEASRKSFENGIDNMIDNDDFDESAIVNLSLNRILYGPPGTGKTYRTTELAVQCVAPDWYDELNDEYLDEPERRELIKAKYDELNAEGRIAFTTFHQSFSYEDFVEGIRAKTDEETKQVSYEVESGVFKQIAIKAGNTIKSEKFEGLSNSPKIWKLSIGEVKEREFRKNCLDNNEARIGWHKTGDLSVDYDNRTLVEKSYWDSLKKAQSSLNCFANDISVGDVILCLKSELSIQAIGIVTSDYKYDENAEGLNQYYPHIRSVKWIARGMNLNILPLNNNYKMVPQACYELSRINWDDLLNEVKKQNQYQFLKLVTQETVDKENYVFIVDEINRGNISRIFGELITLLEPDKRKDGTDAREVILPYSKEKFSVPSNLYVLGTMNTADKSLAQLDLALRRRFDFIELLPRPELLDDIEVHGIAVSEILTVINQRIEVLLDREHTIGHSYFWSLKKLNTDDEKEIELGNIFKRRIIPLLQEYFFSDWERIGWVLNDPDPSKPHNEKFIQTESILPKVSELFHSSIKGLSDRRYYINETAFNNPESYKKIFIQPKSKSSDGQA